MRAEDPTPSSKVALSTKPMATSFYMPGLRLPHLPLGDGPDGGLPNWATQLLARAPKGPLPGASEATAPALLPRPKEARPPSHGIPSYGSYNSNGTRLAALAAIRAGNLSVLYDPRLIYSHAHLRRSSARPRPSATSGRFTAWQHRILPDCRHGLQ